MKKIITLILISILLISCCIGCGAVNDEKVPQDTTTTVPSKSEAEVKTYNLESITDTYEGSTRMSFNIKEYETEYDEDEKKIYAYDTSGVKIAEIFLGSPSSINSEKVENFTQPSCEKWECLKRDTLGQISYVAYINKAETKEGIKLVVRGNSLAEIEDVVSKIEITKWEHTPTKEE